MAQHRPYTRSVMDKVDLMTVMDKVDLMSNMCCWLSNYWGAILMLGVTIINEEPAPSLSVKSSLLITRHLVLLQSTK